MSHDSDVAAKSLEEGDAARCASRGSRVPTAQRLYGIQNRNGARIAARDQQRSAQVHRIEPASDGQLIERAFNRERVVALAHRTPVAQRDIGDQRDIFDPLAADGIGQICSAGDGPRIFGIVTGLGVALNIDRGRDVAIDQATEGIAGIQTRLYANGRAGPVHIVLEVLLTRPDQLDRLANGLSNLDRLTNIVLLDLATETAAEEGRVNRDRTRIQPGDGLDRRNAELLTLGRSPNLARGRRHRGGAVQDLHTGMGQEGQIVGHVDLGLSRC